VFKIIKGHKTYAFYDIAQFYGYATLEESSQRFLGKGKMEVDRSLFSPQYIEEHFDLIVEYCKRDAQLCGALADKLNQAFIQLGIYPRNFISPASISEREFRKSCWMPRVDKLPRELLTYAYNAYKGGWFEVLQRGYFPEVYQYDINSAYPSEVAQLLDIQYGDWVKSSDYQPKAAYGFIKAEVDIDFCPLSPIMVRLPSVNYNPVGRWETFITKQEFDYINQHLGKATVIDGWWFFPWEYTRPFKRKVKHLFQAKREAEAEGEELVAMVSKLLLNSLYGKFFQKNPHREGVKTGQLFNPIYASIICAQVRLKIHQAIKDRAGEVIMIATDSVMTTAPLNLNHGDTLGGWRLADQGEAVVLGSGIYTLRGKEIKSRFRGLKATKRFDWFDLLQEEARNGNSSKITLHLDRAIGLPEALSGDFERLACFVSQPRTIDINFDHKRFWLKKFNSASEVLSQQHKSAPLPYLFLPNSQ